MKKTSLIILLLVCLGASCTQSDAPMNDVKQLTSAVLTSDKFKTLGVEISRLNVGSSFLDTTPSGKKLLIIPARIDGKNHALFSILENGSEVAFAAYMEIELESNLHSGAAFKPAPVPNPVSPDDPNPAPTTPPSNNDPVSAAYHAGTFNGSIAVTASTNYRVLYSFYHSDVTGALTIPIGSGANTDRCRGWTETGGPLDCAGKALVNTGPISAAACYWSFGYCFGALVIDCWWTGC